MVVSRQTPYWRRINWSKEMAIQMWRSPEYHVIVAIISSPQSPERQTCTIPYHILLQKIRPLFRHSVKLGFDSQLQVLLLWVHFEDTELQTCIDQIFQTLGFDWYHNSSDSVYIWWNCWSLDYIWGTFYGSLNLITWIVYAFIYSLVDLYTENNIWLTSGDD